MSLHRSDIFELIETMSQNEKEQLLEDLRIIIEAEKNSPPKSYLEEQWDEIRRQMKSLDFEPYIDDQVEIDIIWDICKELIGSGKIKNEEWLIRKRIVTEIIDGEFFDYYGVFDPMEDLFSALCITPEEKLECADLAFRTGSDYMKNYCAKLYLENGKPEKYYAFLETRLGREEAPYLELIEHFHDSEPGKALQIAEQGWSKCKDRQTGLAVFLIRNAQEKGDNASVQKYMRSAKTRRIIDFAKVQKEITITDN